MKQILILMIVLSVGLFISCEKEEISYNVDPSLIDVSFTSSENTPDSKVSYTYDDDKYLFEWSVGDEVSLIVPGTGAVNAKFKAQTASKSSDFSGSITPWEGSKNVFSIFPYRRSPYSIIGAEDVSTARINLSAAFQDIQIGENNKYRNCYMVAAASGARAVSSRDYYIPALNFKQVMSVLKLNITDIPAEERVTAVFIRTQAAVLISNTDVEMSTGDIVGKATKGNELKGNVKGSTSGVDTEVNMGLFPVDLSGEAVNIIVQTNGITTGEKSYTFAKTGINFERNVIYSLTVELESTIVVPTQELLLTPNEVFFFPCSRLKNRALPDTIGTSLNQFKVFSHTSNWYSPKDTIVWGVDAEGSGEIQLTPILSVPESQAGSIIKVSFAGETKEITLRATGETGTGKDKKLVFANQETLSFTIPSSGRNELRLQLKSITIEDAVSAISVQGVHLSCGSSLKVIPVFLRWRPLAVHAGWESTTAPKERILYVHENTVMTPWTNMYAPITTPFGYNGSPWQASDNMFEGINFSIWSYGKGQPAPPVDKYNHLIAVGEGSRIEGFSHEGTGVKARRIAGAPGIYDNAVGKTTQVIAIGKIPGNPYDTYYSYYLDLDSRKWKFYGCAKKYNKTGRTTYMSTGAFVEQPGAADSQRSGHLMREVQYRGWIMDVNRNWSTIDKMKSGGGVESRTYKNRGVKNGRFFMQTGGFNPIPGPAPSEFTLRYDGITPDFLTSESLKDLIVAGSEIFKIPVEINTLEPTNITSSSAKVNFDIPDIGTNSTVTLFYGETNGLTFTKGSPGYKDYPWSNIVILDDPQNGTNSHDITGLKSGTKYYYRLQIVSDQGETWSFDTETLTTK